MVTKIPVAAMPGLSWSSVLKELDDSAGNKQAEHDVRFLLETAQDLIDKEAKDISVVTIGYSPENHLIAFHKRGCLVRAVVCDPEYIQDAVVESIKHQCHARFYLNSDPDLLDIHDVSLVTVLGTTFSQFASTEQKAREFICMTRAMLSKNASVVIELSTKPVLLATPRRLTVIDESTRFVSQQLVCSPAHIKEILTYEATLGDERIAVQNIRTFHDWGELKLYSLIQSCGFTCIRTAEQHGKNYIIASINDSLPQRKVLWHTNLH